jgi:hypothetical protein
VVCETILTYARESQWISLVDTGRRS